MNFTKNKKNNSGNPIIYDAQNLAFEKSLEYYKTINENINYLNITNFINSDETKIYLSRKIYDEILSICCFITNNIWNFENNYKFNKVCKIKTRIPFEDIENLFIDYKKYFVPIEYNDKYSFKRIITFTTHFKRKVFSIFKKILFLSKNYNYYHRHIEKNNNTSEKLIAIKVVQGIDESFASDISWLDKNTLPYEKILFYVDNYSELDTLLKNKLIKNSQIEDIYVLSNFKKEYNILRFNYLKSEKHINLNDRENWILQNINELIGNANLWYSIFYKFAVKMSIDITPNNSRTNLAKNLAIKALNGNSIGFLRTYPQSIIKSQFFGYFFDDYYFVWGEDSASKMKKTRNHIKNYIISGYPYLELKNYYKKNKFFLNSKKFFNILLIDNSHSNNINNININSFGDIHYFQLFYRKEIINFYSKFLELIENNKNYRLIIKPKKYNEFVKLKTIVNRINQVKIKDRIFVIKHQNIRTSQLKLYTDLSVVTSFYYPSILVENIISNIKTVFYDVYNVCKNEENLKNLVKNNNIFNDIDKLILTIKKNKNIGSNNFSILSKVNSFKDNYKKYVSNELIKIINRL